MVNLITYVKIVKLHHTKFHTQGHVRRPKVKPLNLRNTQKEN